ncbi:hypothetical protein GW17_00056903 [Ensete ventricosum]|nr:hypothetical protein GW17_00056903 [Ensete ventricosum]
MTVSVGLSPAPLVFLKRLTQEEGGDATIDLKDRGSTWTTETRVEGKNIIGEERENPLQERNPAGESLDGGKGK